ncbi:MAG TPA: hypothetical protein VLA28_07355 [Afifellaceae bacterium]|nr:hypothetical protein [Afifellaceae bacterium]
MMIRSIPTSIAGTVIAAVIAAGCSSESSKVATPVEACTLLTSDEVDAAFARTFDAATPWQSAGGGENQAAMTSCSWEAPGAEVAGDIGASVRNMVFINLMAWSWPAGSGGGDNYLASFEKAARELNMPAPVAVALGDAAHWNGETMNVKKGDVTLSLTVSGPLDGPALRAAAESLTKSALGRL